MEDLKNRVYNFHEYSVSSRLISAIVDGKQKNSPLHMSSDEFNGATESYYRNELRKHHISEALSILKEDLAGLYQDMLSESDPPAKALRYVLEDLRAPTFIDLLRDDVVDGHASLEHLVKLIHLILVVEYIDQRAMKHDEADNGPAPIYRAGNS